MFTLALLCDPGCEEVAALEVKELLGKATVVKSAYVTIPDCSIEDAARLCYHTQSGARILVQIAEGSAATVAEFSQVKDALLAFDYSPFLKEDGKFRATCEHSGNQKYQGREVEEELGALLHEEKKLPVDLDEPSMTLFCTVHNDAFVIGIDLCNRDLGKREYKVFHTRRSLRGTVAYAAVRKAGFTGKEALLDPYSSDGSIAIEAALFSTKTSPHRFKREFSFLTMPVAAGEDWKAFFEQEDAAASNETKITALSPLLPGLKSGRSNAKLAGVEKCITLTKTEISWMDTKFKEGSIDCIVTALPTSGKHTPLKQVEKLHDDLFYQARHVLKQEGKVLLIAEKKAELLNAAQHHKFSLEAEQSVWMGQKEVLLLTFAN